MVSVIKKKAKNIKLLRDLYFLMGPFKEFFRFSLFSFISKYIWFFKTYRSFKKDRNPFFTKLEFYPCLFDNTEFTPVEPIYFFQDAWAARKIFELKPKYLVDVGSYVKTMSIISQFIPVIMVDIRPIKLNLKGLNFVEGSILDLPFKDEEIEIISSLCVVEHIGLGRYGDELDAFGSEKAIKELKRVVKVGGWILFSVHVDKENKIYFNAHRAFTRNYILELFEDCCELYEEKYIYGNNLEEKYDPEKGFGTGLYLFRKVRPCS